MNEAMGKDNITYMNLCETYKDFNFDIPKEQERLSSYDRIVFQFPIFWYSSPGILKTYVDSVFTYGFAYGSKGNALKDNEFMMCVTAGANEEDLKDFTIDECLKGYELTAKYCKMKTLKTYAFYNAGDSSEDELKEGAKNFLNHITKEY